MDFRNNNNRQKYSWNVQTTNFVDAPLHGGATE